MASDIKFTINKATADQSLIPTNVSADLEQRFLKKSKADAFKLIPISFIAAAIVIVIIALLIYFLRIIAISTIGILFIIFPIYAICDAFATSKAVKNHDYDFYYGEITGKTEYGNYIIKGLEEQNIMQVTILSLQDLKTICI